MTSSERQTKMLRSRLRTIIDKIHREEAERIERNTPIWDQLMSERCGQCGWFPASECPRCCPGCGEDPRKPGHAGGGWCTGFYSL